MHQDTIKRIKIVIVVCCVLGIGALAGGMFYHYKAGALRGSGKSLHQTQHYAQLSKQVNDKADAAVQTAASSIQKEKAKQAEAAKKARERQQEMKSQASGRSNAKAGPVSWNSSWQYAGYSKIHTGQAILYKAGGRRKDIVVGINAGHGTQGGNSVRTQCHPDGSAKIVSGSTAAGETTAAAVSGGTTLLDGTSEAEATLAVAQQARDDLLAAGYDVLMLRDGADVQLDNIARTVMANNNADCHISIHYDSSQSDKGFFCISVPNVASYRSMEPVASHWQQHNALGESLLAGARAAGLKIMGSGSMAIDLTQTSYSTIPSVDVEVGDRASDHSAATVSKISRAIVAGVEGYF